jgi:hypothetical protein
MSRDLFSKGPGSDLPDYVIEAAGKGARRVLDALCKRLTLDIVSAAVGLSAPHIRQALDGKEGRKLDLADHLRGLKVATDAERLAWLTEVSAALGYRPTPVSPRTDTERLRDLEYRVAAGLGPAGVALVEDERSRP